MTATSHYRGNPVIWEDDNQRWVYADTGEPTPGWGGENRPCGLCGRKEWPGDGFTVDYHDLPLIRLQHFQSQHADWSLYWLFSNEIRMRKQIQRCGLITINGASQQ